VYNHYLEAASVLSPEIFKVNKHAKISL